MHNPELCSGDYLEPVVFTDLRDLNLRGVERFLLSIRLIATRQR
jgi:hypothetical protein